MLKKNASLLTDKIIYARSCDAARVLGKVCADKYNATFIGYERSYVLGRNPYKAGRPMDDEVAKLFIEPSNLVPRSLIKGNTAKEAYKKSQKAMEKNFFFMLSSNATSNQRDAAAYLWANKRNQVIKGDVNAKV